ncbi:MAG: RNA polymerase sigma factor [Fimbriiglobus sp.]
MNDRDWITAAVDRYERPLRVYVRGMLGEGSLEQDVVQEAFLELCRQPRAAIEPRLAAWLFTVCRRRVIDIVRKEKRMTHLVGEPPTRHPDPSEALAHSDLTQTVLTRVGTLPENQREAVRLKFLQQFSYREIAEIMGISESHVGVLLHTALKKLRETFTPEHSLPGATS